MKKLKINLLAIIGMMVAVTTLAFTAPKENTNLNFEWYEVTPHPSDPDLDEIGPPTDTPTAGDCSTLNDLNRCAIQLDLSGAPLPETVEDAMDDPNITVGQSTYQDKAL